MSSPSISAGILMTSRPNPAPIKVVCVGLGRTGTLSLASALEILQLGPCYHPLTKSSAGLREDFPTWMDIENGHSTPDVWDKLLQPQGYQAILDYTAAIHFCELYAAYPDAKYILTIRDPIKWEKSIQSTIISAYNSFREQPEGNPGIAAFLHWYKTSIFEKYHGGRLQSHAQEEFHAHTKRVKELIPQNQLLIYEVSEGWEKLCDFLGVSKPSQPFPHLNDTSQFFANLTTALDVGK